MCENEDADLTKDVVSKGIKKPRAIVYSRCPLSLFDLLRSVKEYDVQETFNFIVAYEDVGAYSYLYKKLPVEFPFVWRFDGVHPDLFNSYLFDIFIKSKTYNYLYLRENARFIRPVIYPHDTNQDRRNLINLKMGEYDDTTSSFFVRYKHDFDENPSMNGCVIGASNLFNFVNGFNLKPKHYHFNYKSIQLIGEDI